MANHLQSAFHDSHACHTGDVETQTVLDLAEHSSPQANCASQVLLVLGLACTPLHAMLRAASTRGRAGSEV